ncbi:glycosyltransferase [Cryomorphaceae bacterium]|nr:glycosyltransferase [Cryomorphaceae bacterium]
MKTLSYLIIALYTGMMTFIFFYALVQLSLVIHYVRAKRKGFAYPKPKDFEEWPMVTVQLPVYNERYVVERLIEATAALDYPVDRMEIQVLDDSTDDTVERIAESVNRLRSEGYTIHHVRRPHRQGYKAGALAFGLESARGEYVAIFDADFVPKPDFLMQCIPLFADDNIGLVQSRWEHLNENHSLLTRMQAFGLNAHFSVEQGGRYAGEHFINFNGTAGVWRRSCIDDAGGWASDTLTEDLDLSYRAQLRGWKFHFIEELGSPAELPASMNALKTQQFRWTKGAAECARKNLGKVLRAPIGWSTKIHATFHLMNSFLFLCILFTAILSVPMLFIKDSFPEFRNIFYFGSFFVISLLILTVFYWVSYVHRETRPRLHVFLIKFPMFLSVSMGMSLHNAVAVLEGLIGRKTPFVRTPKFNVEEGSTGWRSNVYLKSALNIVTLVEGLLAAYFIGALYVAYELGDFGLVPYHLMLAFGFGTVYVLSVLHSIRGSWSK